jgi:hypothetical protein
MYSIHNNLDKIITSDMYKPFYNTIAPYQCVSVGQFSINKVYFISDVTIINSIIKCEMLENNIYTTRKQAYLYNYMLLKDNPVSAASLLNTSYLHEQHKLFISLAKNINIDDIQLPDKQIVDYEIVSVIVSCVSQVYFPILLNVDTVDVLNIQDEIKELLSIVESATGKHDIMLSTIISEMTNNEVKYSDDMETQYLNLFYKIILKLKHCENRSSTPLKHIVELLSDSNIISVLTTQFNGDTNARVIVNNIISWIDNMLNLVYTIVNCLILMTDTSTSSDYKTVLPKANALATMFMRKVLVAFDIFKPNDIIMMSNRDKRLTFGGRGRKCPSQPWSYIFMDKILKLLHNNYTITMSKPIISDITNQSWFWNKLSPIGLLLVPL